MGILISGILFSCKSELEKKEDLKKKDIKKIIENLTAYINGTIVSESEDLILDSFAILRIDTLNEKKDSIAAQYSIVRYSSKLKNAIEENDKLLQIREKQEKLAKELGNDPSEYSDQVVKHLRKKVDYNISLTKLYKHYTKLDSLIKYKMLDTIKNTGYEVITKVYAHDSKQVNKDVDSIGFYLDKNLRINTKNIDRANTEIK